MKSLILLIVITIVAAVVLMSIANPINAGHNGHRHQLPLIVSKPVGVKTVREQSGGSRADPGTFDPTRPTDPCRLVDNYNWPKRTAYAVCRAESGGNPKAINWRDYHRHAKCHGSFGLMQLACFWVGHLKGIGHQNDLLDGPANIRAAHDLYLRSDKSFHHWSAYKNGSYKRYLSSY